MFFIYFQEELSSFGKAYNKASQYRQKYGKYVNYAIFYGIIPFVLYKGLKHGTHKYVDPESQVPMPKSRKPRVTDLLPVIGSHGLP